MALPPMITASGPRQSLRAVDVFCRYFTYRGYQVKYVQNFTDIDDKIIAKPKRKVQSLKRWQSAILKTSSR